MIKLSIVVFAVITALASTCNKEKSESATSDSCLETLKAQLLEQPPQLPASVIWEYFCFRQIKEDNLMRLKRLLLEGNCLE